MPDQSTETLLRELLAWTRLANRSAFVQTVHETMVDPKDLRAFEATDGTRSQEEVAEFAGLSQPTVSRLWARWRRLGLVDSVGGRPKHLARPSDLGMEIPAPPLSGPESAP